MIDGRFGGDILVLEAPAMFLKNAIEKILNDPTTKKNAELKKACESALGMAFGLSDVLIARISVKLQADIERQSKQLANQDVLPHHRDFILADEYFHPFELACQSRNQKTVTTALDCLQVPFAHINIPLVSKHRLFCPTVTQPSVLLRLLPV